jgi:serine/threonine-protein kinase RsbW
VSDDIVEVTVFGAGDLAHVRRAVRRLLAMRAVDEVTVAEVVLATQEAAKNALSVTEAPDQCAWVTLAVTDDEAIVEVVDCGCGFASALQGERPPDPLAENGRGVFLMRRYMDSVEVAPCRVGTHVRMRRRLRGHGVRRRMSGA